MQIGMIGLGRMGANMVRRLMKDGHECVVWDIDPAAAENMKKEGAVPADSLQVLTDKLSPPRTVWIMIPAAFVESTVAALTPLCTTGDLIIDGGNSFYRDAVDRAAALAEQGLLFMDVGVSGGVHGLERGYCLMAGGAPEAFSRVEPALKSLAPGVDAAPRTDGAVGEPTRAEQGYLHCGPPGAGHLVKMVHNGIEYGIMAAYAEGFNLMTHAGIGRKDPSRDAETAPVRDPQYFQYDIPVEEVAEVWRRGSVIESWLLDLTAKALRESPSLDEYQGKVSDSGEGRWTILTAVETGTPAHVLSAAVFDRFSSRNEGLFANKVLSAMRKQFGGHHEKKD